MSAKEFVNGDIDLAISFYNYNLLITDNLKEYLSYFLAHIGCSVVGTW